MNAETGVIVDLEGGNHQINTREEGQLGYLEDNVVGGGLLQELPDNHRTLKAKIRTPNDDLVQVSMPSANVMKLGDVITVVQDDDGCEFYYRNHTSDRVWVYPRCPANVRWLRKWAGYGIIWGFFGAGIIGSIAGFNMTVGACIAIAIASLVWSLVGRPRAARRHLENAEALAQEDASTHAVFIAGQDHARFPGGEVRPAE